MSSLDRRKSDSWNGFGTFLAQLLVIIAIIAALVFGGIGAYIMIQDKNKHTSCLAYAELTQQDAVYFDYVGCYIKTSTGDYKKVN